MHYKKIAYFAALIILLVAINNLTHSIYTTWEKQKLITKAHHELTQTTEENMQLKQSVAQVTKPGFIESEARNKLLLTKQDEGIIVIPTNAEIRKITPTPVPVDSSPNWEKWWKVFF